LGHGTASKARAAAVGHHPILVAVLEQDRRGAARELFPTEAERVARQHEPAAEPLVAAATVEQPEGGDRTG
jgi:hypothetical protein